MRLLCKILFAAIVFSLSGGVHADDSLTSLEPITAKMESGDPVVIATFGDSITWPCYHTDYRQNYISFAVDALRKAYPSANVRIVHAGNMGSTGRGLTDGRFEKHVLVHKPDLVFIMFGMNDCAGGPAGLQTYDANLTTLIGKTREAGAIPIVATQNEIFYSHSDGRDALPLYMARGIEVAKRERVPAVDCFALWKPLTVEPARFAAHLNDYFHPNHAGHRLMAYAIVKTLWPKAAQHVSIDERTPLKPEEAESTASLVPGPPGKQILRTADGTWYAISGRRRNQQLTDLVFSFSRAERPTWQDFRHITLVGTREDAVFDAMDRTITAGMLLEKDGKVYVVFSWNVGVFLVTTRQPTVQLDLTRPPQVQSVAARQWEQDLVKPGSWLEYQSLPMVRPVSVANSSHRDGALLFDAYLQSDGWPAVLCSGRELFPGGGWENTDGIDGIFLIETVAGQKDPVRKMLFPEFQLARCAPEVKGGVYFAAQQTKAAPLQVGVVGSKPFVESQPGVSQFLLASRSGAGITLVFERENLSAAERWSRLTVSSDQQHSIKPLLDPTDRAVPLPWSDNAREGIVWWTLKKAGPIELAYESQLPPDATSLAVLSAQGDKIHFELLPIAQ